METLQVSNYEISSVQELNTDRFLRARANLIRVTAPSSTLTEWR